MKWMVALAMLCSLVVQAEDVDGGYFFKGKSYSISYTLKNNVQEVRLEGELYSGVVENLDGLMKVQELLQPGVDIKLILNSGGGYQKLFNELSSFLKSACYGGCKITTINSSMCASACVPLFMAGDVRKANKYSMFGFHQSAVVPGFFKINGKMERDLLNSGVDSFWLEKNKHLFKTLEMTWLMAYQLEESNIVTRITD